MAPLVSLPYEIKTQCHRFEGQVAIVTGAAQGLGRVMARRFAEEGCMGVVIADVKAERAQRTARQLQQSTETEFLAFGGDLSLPGVADQMAKQTIERFGRIDALVNNAAALIRIRFTEFPEELMNKAVEWNIWPTIRCCKAVVPYMIQRKYGRIVMIGGGFNMTSQYHTMLSGIGKGGIISFGAALAGEVIRDGITVNSVSPGGMESEADGDPEQEPKNYDPTWNPPGFAEWAAARGKANRETGNGIGRPAHPTEVAAVAVFLASPEVSYMTGQHMYAAGQ